MLKGDPVKEPFPGHAGPVDCVAISKDGTNAGDFAIGPLGVATLAAGASATFTVTFSPAAAGLRAAALHIASTDADENPFDINILAGDRDVLQSLGGNC